MSESLVSLMTNRYELLMSSDVRDTIIGKDYININKK